MTPTKALQTLVEMGIDSRSAGYKLDVAQKNGTVKVAEGITVNYAYGDFEVRDDRLTETDLAGIRVILEQTLLRDGADNRPSVQEYYDKISRLLSYEPN